MATEAGAPLMGFLHSFRQRHLEGLYATIHTDLFVPPRPPTVLKMIIQQVLQSSKILQFKSSALLALLPNHQLGGAQSVWMFSQQLLKCNNYSFFLFLL